MANEDLRRIIFESNIPKWKIAKEYGCTDSTFSKKLRMELPQEEKDKIIEIINKLKFDSSSK